MARTYGYVWRASVDSVVNQQTLKMTLDHATMLGRQRCKQTVGFLNNLIINATITGQNDDFQGNLP